jgi:hypothetical protein
VWYFFVFLDFGTVTTVVPKSRKTKKYHTVVTVPKSIKTKKYHTVVTVPKSRKTKKYHTRNSSKI